MITTMNALTPDQQSVQQPAATLAPPVAPPRILTQDEKNDLRRHVLAGGSLTDEQARSVVASLHINREVALAASTEKAARKSSKKGGISDAELDSSLDAALGL